MQATWQSAACLLAWLTGSVAAASAAVAPYDRFPELAKSYAVVVDDRLVWAREPDVPRAPASLTKLITALELLQTRWQPDTPISISATAAAVQGSRAGLRAGESLRARDLLTAMLIRSANDACMALVEQAAPSQAEFSARLNRRAAALGMTRSHFVHPCGLDAPGQVTTARDLTLLAKAAMANGEIGLRAGAASAEIVTLAKRRITVRATNQLLAQEEDVIGLKSGYTNEAGLCLIAVAQRRKHRVTVVMLNAPNRWWGAAAVLYQGFAVSRGMEP